jgi:hypothetical protein
MFAPATVGRRKMRNGSSGHGERSSTRTNDAMSAEQRESGGRAPAVARGARQRVDEQHEPAGHGHRAGDVEVPVAQVGPALAQEHGRDCGRRNADGDVDEEDPGPAQVAGEDAAKQDAGSRAAARGGAVDPQRKVAVAALREGGHQERQRRGREQRPAEALEGAETDQRALRPRDPAKKRACGEEEKTADEQPAPAKEIRQATTEEQRPAEEDRVRRDDPLQARRRKAEVGLDRREGDVHYRYVEDDHELRRDYESQSAPAPSTIRSASHQLTSNIVDVDNDSKNQP